MLAKGGLGVHDPTSWTRFVLVYISNTDHARALIFTVNLYFDVKGVKNAKNERSFEKMNMINYDDF